MTETDSDAFEETKRLYHNGLTQEEVAERLGVSQAAVSYRLDESRPRGPPEETLLRDLEGLTRALGRPPSAPEYSEEGHFAPSTLIRRFGSWREAHAAAGNDISDRCEGTDD